MYFLLRRTWKLKPPIQLSERHCTAVSKDLAMWIIRYKHLWNTLLRKVHHVLQEKVLSRIKLKDMYMYEEQWLNKIRGEHKMRTCVKFKSFFFFIKANYLHIQDSKLRYATVRLHISMITFSVIERGQYARSHVHVPSEERVCRT